MQDLRPNNPETKLKYLKDGRRIIIVGAIVRWRKFQKVITICGWDTNSTFKGKRKIREENFFHGRRNQ